MAETTWNLTIPDSSPMIDYEGFIESCPTVVNGLARCDQGSAHVSNDTSATLTINFYGRAIYLFGSVDGGTQYTTTLDEQDAINGTVVVGNLLASYENLSSPSAGETHQITLTATQYTAQGALSFTEAIVSVGTGLTGASASFTTYKAVGDSQSPIRFTPGWTTNGTYKQSGTQFSQTATLNFTGSAVVVRGLCSPFRDSTGFQSSYGSVAVDGGEETFLEDDTTLFFSLPNYEEDDCILYYNTGLNDGQHGLVYQTNSDDVFISSMQVLGVSGGTTAGADSGDGSSGNSTGPGGFQTSGSQGNGGLVIPLQLSLTDIIGIVAGAVVLCIVGGVLIWAQIVKKRRRRQQNFLGAPLPYRPKPNEPPISYRALASQASLPQQHSHYPPPAVPPPLQIQSFSGPVALDDSGYTPAVYQQPGRRSTPVNTIPSDVATYGSSPSYPQPQGALHEYDAAQTNRPPGLQLNVMAAPQRLENFPPKMRQEMRWAMQNASTPYTAATTPANYYDPRRDPNLGPQTFAETSMAAGSSTGTLTQPPLPQVPQVNQTTQSTFQSRQASVRRLTQVLFDQGNGAAEGDEAPPPDYSQATR